MRWLDPVLIHWRADPAALVGRLPDGVVLDRYDRDAWVSEVALKVEGPAPGALTRLRPFRYLQLNLRTYVRGPEGPGIVLLDTCVSRDWAAVAGRIAGRPYRPVARAALAERMAAMRAAIIPRTSPFTPGPSSLDAFLLERYWTYGGRPFGYRVAHAPWRPRAGLIERPFRGPVEASGHAVRAHLAESLDVTFAGVLRRPREEEGQKLASTPTFSAPID